MFSFSLFSKQKKDRALGLTSKEDADFESQVRRDGVQYAGKRIADVLNQRINSKSLAKQFVLEELDAARGGNDFAINFVKNSGFRPSEYIGAMSQTSWEGDESELEQIQLFVRSGFMSKISDIDLMVQLSTTVVDEIMKIWKLGKYELFKLGSAKIQSDQNKIIEIDDNVLAWIDESTNLMWEVKNSDNANYMYAWHKRYVKTAQMPSSGPFEIEIKDAASYVERLNANKYAGFSDWRLPSVEELESLIDYDGDNLFVKMPLQNNTASAYWTDTPTMVVDVYQQKGTAPYSDWKNTTHISGIKIVDFIKPLVSGYKPDNTLWVRCVRSN